MTATRLTLLGLVSPLVLSFATAAQVPAMSALEREISEGSPAVAFSAPSTELQRALASKNYERAEQLLADAIARQPTSQSLLTQIASVFMLDRKPLNAAIALKKAEALGPLDNRRGSSWPWPISQCNAATGRVPSSSALRPTSPRT